MALGITPRQNRVSNARPLKQRPHTPPGQGYVRHLLAVAHERNRAAGYDLAMLFTRSPWVYSGSAGFSVLPFWGLALDFHRLVVSSGPIPQA
jgi:hypothetical protein